MIPLENTVAIAFFNFCQKHGEDKTAYMLVEKIAEMRFS